MTEGLVDDLAAAVEPNLAELPDDVIVQMVRESLAENGHPEALTCTQDELTVLVK